MISESVLNLEMFQAYSCVSKAKVTAGSNFVDVLKNHTIDE